MMIRKTIFGFVAVEVVAWSASLISIPANGQGSETASDTQLAELAAEVELPPGKNWKTLVISTVQTIKSDLTVPPNLCLRFEDGGVCDVQEGVTLTINGPVEAPLAEIFRGSGKVKFGRGRVEKVYPQWWGGVTDDDLDDTAAIQAAINSLSWRGAWTSGHVPRNGGVVFFPGGRYDISSTLKVYDGTTLEGTPNSAVLRATKHVPAILQRPDLTPPPQGSDFNPAGRINGVKIANLLLQGDGSNVGLDLTNISYASIENVYIVECKTGILMDQLSICNVLINPGIAHCDTGIEVVKNGLDVNIFSGRISSTKTGLLIRQTYQFNIYGTNFEDFKETAIDIRKGDSVNLINPLFDSVAPSVPIRIAPGSHSCSVLNPRFSGPTPKVVDNQSDTTMILDASPDPMGENFPSEFLRAKFLQTSGISQTNLGAKNLRGRVAVSDTRSSAVVTFSTPEPDDNYFLVATCVSTTGSPPADARHIFIKDKARTGFEVCLDTAPGVSNSVTVDWILMR